MDDAATPSDALPRLQRKVQRKLGRCLLQLQQYEKLLKAMVSRHEVSGPLDQLEAIREKMANAVQQKTLGTLMGMLTDTYMTSPVVGDRPQSAQVETDDQTWFSYRHELQMPSENYEMTKVALRELVGLRNQLVNHFIDRFDLWSVDGCSTADEFLEESYKTIHQHYLNLRDWAKGMNEAQETLALWLQSPAADGIFDAGSIHGSVDGSDHGIYACLKEAEAKFAEGGWTHLGCAIRWIASCYPEQTPKRYGYSSWRQILHESKQFETRIDRAGREPAVVWYRGALEVVAPSRKCLEPEPAVRTTKRIPD